MTSIKDDILSIIRIYIDKDVWDVEDVWEDLVSEHPWMLELDDTEHTIQVSEGQSWVVQHPISERLKGTLFECDFHKDYSNHNPGTYRV